MSKANDYPPYDRDDDLLRAVAADGLARRRIVVCEGLSVVIGRGGDPALELDESAIRGDGVPILQRRGGGCAVVLDPGNALVSVVLPRPGLAGIGACFSAVNDWLCSALAACGIPGVRPAGISDLAIGERKVGGSCIYRRRDLLYFAATLLVDPDLERVARYLPHPPREPEYRQGRPHSEFMGRMADVFPGLSTAGLAAELDARLRIEELPTDG